MIFRGARRVILRPSTWRPHSTRELNTYITKRYRYDVSAARCSISGGLKFRRKEHKSSGRLSREISNAAINCRSKRVKRSGREIKSDGRSGRPLPATLSAQRENRAAIIVSYGDHAGVYLFAVAPVIYDENASADTLYIRPRPMYITCIDDASIFHRKVPKRVAPVSPPPPHPCSPHKSTAFKSVTVKIRSDVPHLSQSLLDSVGIRLRYREIFWRRRSAPRFTTCAKDDRDIL